MSEHRDDSGVPDRAAESWRKREIQRWRKRLATLRTAPSHEVEFLPAALEILETPPSPAGRWVVRLLILLFVLALIWAFVGRIDVNAVASGQVVPLGGVKEVQPFETGIVRQILVDNGQHVKRGDLLVKLDSVEEQVSLQQLERQLKEAQSKAGMLQSFLASPDGSVLAAGWADLDDPQAQRRLQLLAARQSAYEAKLAAARAQRIESQALLAGSASEIRKLDARCALLSNKAQALRTLLDRRGVAKLKYLEAAQELTECEQSRAIEQERTHQHQANLDRLSAELDQYCADLRAQAMTDLVEAKDQASEAALNIERYEQRERYRLLRAPVDGTVQQRAIHTIGGVVQPAQTLMVIVPDDAKLAIEVKLLNLDAGFVRPGQPVRIKIETYPYTKYGTLQGTVQHISKDAVQDEHLGPVFLARVLLNESALTHTGRRLPVFAGMAVSAEIRTDERRVIDYLLSPIKEVAAEAFRER